ncbi:MAG: MarR family winged helix-turn-helix transcriptional regulator [Gammaproteobacteria bacterium]|uniref:MarR family winged helix-turn-helix transcriptional regulator n=1 Tax=Pseudacidovorax intermedius TaxID=433924 RepID=UPI000349746D|nr:MarR family transcriptional regulator [Pseudacidovorax intermedius]
MNHRTFDLQAHLPYLLRRAHFAADAIFSQVYGTDFTSRQLALLVAIAQRPGISQIQAAQEIGLDANTCSDLVMRAIGKDLLRREKSPIDARQFCLYLTPAGEDVLDHGLALAREYQAEVSRRLSEAEREQLAALLRKMLDFGG